MEYTSLCKSRDAIERLFKPIVGLQRQTEEHFYTIRNDWHDIRLRIDLELSEIARAVGTSFSRIFECTWVVGTCPKCIATRDINPEINISFNKNTSETLVRKRKPIDFTIEDLDAGTDDDDSDFETYFDKGDVI